MLLKRTLFCVFGVMQCVYAVQNTYYYPHTVHYCCSSMLHLSYHVVMPCPGTTTKTTKPTINEAFVAFSEDMITHYNDSYGLFMRCAA